MDQIPEGEQTRKKMLKELREARRESIETLAKRVNEQRKVVNGIMEQLGSGPKTVPETASALMLNPSEIMWYFAALKKYGEIFEGEKEGVYFRYGRAENSVTGTMAGKGRE